MTLAHAWSRREIEGLANKESERDQPTGGSGVYLARIDEVGGGATIRVGGVHRVDPAHCDIPGARGGSSALISTRK